MSVLKPRMSDGELLLLLAAAEGKRHVIEYGIGGSTLRLLAAGVETLVSVESDRSWIDRLTEQPAVRSELANGRLTFLNPDIGETGPWGYPTDPTSRNRWAAYAMAPWERFRPHEIDLVLVDGRFRVASTLASILYGNADLTIVIHDFWNRPGYQAVLPYLTCACRAESIGVFFPKRQFFTQILRSELARFATDPS